MESPKNSLQETNNHGSGSHDSQSAQSSQKDQFAFRQKYPVMRVIKDVKIITYNVFLLPFVASHNKETKDFKDMRLEDVCELVLCEVGCLHSLFLFVL